MDNLNVVFCRDTDVVRREKEGSVQTHALEVTGPHGPQSQSTGLTCGTAADNCKFEARIKFPSPNRQGIIHTKSKSSGRSNSHWSARHIGMYKTHVR